MTIAVSGAGGFLGWHTRCAAHALGLPASTLRVGARFDIAAAADTVSGASRLVHIAGVNRGSEEDVLDGNLLFARQIAEAVERAACPPSVVVFADSIQAGNGTVYGEAKAKAADILHSAAERAGAMFIDERLPNLFGEHGLPYYNSVVATFAHQIAVGETPRLDVDQELALLHAQNAADLLLGALTQEAAAKLQVRETVSGILSRLTAIAETYARGGQIPDLSSHFDRDLFNTYRAAAFASTTPIPLDRHADARGSFFEVVRAQGGPGQTSFSTTSPTITRGQHYHRRKVERFTVLAGEAVIALRRLFTTEVHTFSVTSESPVSIDMPTLWAHNITNVGDSPLCTSFWSNELFDPQRPDTIPEHV
ncbi:polysaccharide biosynthesis C-terminal domain-containing protein [Humibacter ginsengisoli]